MFSCSCIFLSNVLIILKKIIILLRTYYNCNCICSLITMNLMRKSCRNNIISEELITFCLLCYLLYYLIFSSILSLLTIYIFGSFLKKIEGNKVPRVTSKKLLDSGFKFKYSLDEMYDDAIECCKQRGYL